MQTDLILFTVAAMACAGLLLLARHLRAREAALGAAAADGSQSGSRGQSANSGMGVVFAAMGLLVTGMVIFRAVHADPLTADDLMGVPAGLMFVFAGMLLGLSPEYAKWRPLLATLVVTCFAVTFDWVAFVPGERKFNGSIGGVGFISGELVGRTLFGIIAVVLDVVAIAMWRSQAQRMAGPDASDEAGPASIYGRFQGPASAASADRTKVE